MSDKQNKEFSEHGKASPLKEENCLFPVFLKLEKLSVLIVGGGYVGMEKLSAILKNSPEANIKLVAMQVSDEIKELVALYPKVRIHERAYQADDVDNADVVFAAVNDPEVSKQVSLDAREKDKLVNAADKPELCDFYLSSIVQKGSLKIAISTNGKSPTVAKRIKEVLNDMIPHEMEELLNNMQSIRNKLSIGFADKVKQLNEITKGLTDK